MNRSKLRRLAGNFDAKPRRERMLYVVCVVAVGIFLFDSVAVTPLSVRSKNANLQLSKARADAQTLMVQEATIDDSKQMPEEVLLAQKIEQIQSMKSDVDRIQARMIPASQIKSFLEGLITEQSARIVLFKTKPVEAGVAPVISPAAAASAPANSDARELPTGKFVFRHRFDLQVEGGYFELLSYVKRIEASPWRILIDRATIEAIDASAEADAHRAATGAGAAQMGVLTLELSTFSMDRQWMHIGS